MEIKKIIIHCTATKPGMKVNGKPVDASVVDSWHKSQGYRCIGYHYLILENGEVQQGRKETEVGAHCLGQNNVSLGVCYVGGLDPVTGRAKDTRTNEQKMSMNLLIARLRAKYGVKEIVGHNEYAVKACPCFDVKKEYK